MADSSDDDDPTTFHKHGFGKMLLVHPPARTVLSSDQKALQNINDIKKLARASGFEVSLITSLVEAKQIIKKEKGVWDKLSRIKRPLCDILLILWPSDCIAGGSQHTDIRSQFGVDIVHWVRRKERALSASSNKYPYHTFVCFYSEEACEMPLVRWELFQLSCHMVTSNTKDLQVALEKIEKITRQRQLAGYTDKLYTCPWCYMTHLEEDNLCQHMFLYHANHGHPNRDCPICGKHRAPLAPHIRNAHGEVGRDYRMQEYRGPVDLYSYALVVCQHPKDPLRFLCVQEFANVGYWLPGGKVDGGEGLREAALRECEEEAGVKIKLTGLLSMRFHPDMHRRQGSVTIRIVFLATPVSENDMTPKTIPDYESVGATWVHIDDLDRLKLRSKEPYKWFHYVAKGGKVYDLEFMDQ